MSKLMIEMRTLAGMKAESTEKPAKKKGSAKVEGSGDAAYDATGHSMAALRTMAGLGPMTESEDFNCGEDETIFEGVASPEALDMRHVIRESSRRPAPKARNEAPIEESAAMKATSARMREMANLISGGGEDGISAEKLNPTAAPKASKKGA